MYIFVLLVWFSVDFLKVCFSYLVRIRRSWGVCWLFCFKVRGVSWFWIVFLG